MFGGMFRGMEQYTANFRAMPVAFIDKPQAEFGDKVFLPPSALQRLGEQLLASDVESADPELHKRKSP
eukprot:1157693-Pelagomonas_calceolata.AAC.5